jgi:hypothetical protein
VQPVDPAQRLGGVVTRGVQAVRQQHDQPLVRDGRRQLPRRLPQPRGEVGGAVPAQRDEVGQQLLGRAARALALQHAHPRAEREDRGLQRRRPVLVGDDDTGGGDGGQRDREPLHRPGDVDDEAHGPPVRRPGAGDELLGPAGRGRVPRLDGAVEVEIAVQPARRAEAPRAAAPRRADPAEPDEHPPGQLPRGRAQLRVGGDGEVGEQGRGRLRVARGEGVEGLDVQLTRLRGHVGELGVVAGELLAALRARAVLATGAGAGLEARAATRARRFSPVVTVLGVRGSGSSAVSAAGQTRSSSSSITDSGLRSTPSAIRMRPDSAAYAASRPVSRDGRASPRRRASPSSTSARSMAPRTELPMRTSRCPRVARVSSTDRSTQRPASPLTDVVMARSAGSSW